MAATAPSNANVVANFAKGKLASMSCALDDLPASSLEPTFDSVFGAGTSVSFSGSAAGGGGEEVCFVELAGAGAGEAERAGAGGGVGAV